MNVAKVIEGAAMRVIIVGAGIVGASVAWQLAQRGAEVVVLDAAQVAAGASGCSFGWINASFYLDSAHHALRVAGMAAWRRADAEASLGDALNWPGALFFEEQGAALHSFYDQVQNMGYAATPVDSADFAALEPQVASPDEAVLLPQEGCVDLAAATRQVMQRAQALGARLITGAPVTGLVQSGERITGVRTPVGDYSGDNVVLATGTGTPDILADVGLSLHMPPRPGLLMWTRPVAPCLRHILVSPLGEIRQTVSGRILIPTAASHQSDTTEKITTRPDILAAEALDKLRALFPGVALEWEQVSLAYRPVPQDGLPVIGPAGPDGLYVATLHSGATLGPLVGELVAAELCEDRQVAELAPYRFTRF